MATMHIPPVLGPISKQDASFNVQLSAQEAQSALSALERAQGVLKGEERKALKAITGKIAKEHEKLLATKARENENDTKQALMEQAFELSESKLTKVKRLGLTEASIGYMEDIYSAFNKAEDRENRHFSKFRKAAKPKDRDRTCIPLADFESVVFKPLMRDLNKAIEKIDGAAFEFVEPVVADPKLPMPERRQKLAQQCFNGALSFANQSNEWGDDLAGQRLKLETALDFMRMAEAFCQGHVSRLQNTADDLYELLTSPVQQFIDGNGLQALKDAQKATRKAAGPKR